MQTRKTGGFAGRLLLRTGMSFALSAILCLLCGLAFAGGESGGPDPLAHMKGKKAVVLLFIATDCPISNSYAPEIQRICARYEHDKIAFTLVYPDPATTLADAQKHVKEYGYTCPLVLDPAHRLVRKAGVTVTPEAAVFASDGKLLYRGRIDDLYVGFGKNRPIATKHDLRAALDAIVSGKPVQPRTTQAIGCFI